MDSNKSVIWKDTEVSEIHLAPCLFLDVVHESSLTKCGDLYFGLNSVVHSHVLNVNRSQGSIRFDNGETAERCLDTAEYKIVEAGSNELVMLVRRRLNRISSAQVMIKKLGSPRRCLFCRG